jgi:MFS family permease
MILGANGIVGCAGSFLFGGRIQRHFGHQFTTQLGVAVYAASFVSQCVAAQSTALHGTAFNPVTVAVLCSTTFSGTIYNTAFGSAASLVNASLPSQSRDMGSLNGLAQVAAAAFRTVGPTLTTSLFAVLVQRLPQTGGAAFSLLMASISLVVAAALRFLQHQE